MPSSLSVSPYTNPISQTNPADTSSCSSIQKLSRLIKQCLVLITNMFMLIIRLPTIFLWKHNKTEPEDLKQMLSNTNASLVISNLSADKEIDSETILFLVHTCLKKHAALSTKIPHIHDIVNSSIENLPEDLESSLHLLQSIAYNDDDNSKNMAAKLLVCIHVLRSVKLMQSIGRKYIEANQNCAFYTELIKARSYPNCIPTLQALTILQDQILLSQNLNVYADFIREITIWLNHKHIVEFYQQQQHYWKERFMAIKNTYNPEMILTMEPNVWQHVLSPHNLNDVNKVDSKNMENIIKQHDILFLYSQILSHMVYEKISGIPIITVSHNINYKDEDAIHNRYNQASNVLKSPSPQCLRVVCDKFNKILVASMKSLGLQSPKISRKELSSLHALMSTEWKEAIISARQEGINMPPINDDGPATYTIPSDIPWNFCDPTMPILHKISIEEKEQFIQQGPLKWLDEPFWTKEVILDTLNHIDFQNELMDISSRIHDII